MQRQARSPDTDPSTPSTSPAPRLSIGVPVYNGEKYLAEALDAILGQTFTDFELIISDNASTDGTEELCRKYAASDSRIRYYRQPRNLESAGNHNFVFEQARGELFKLGSHDDLYARDLLQRCVDALDEHPDVVLAHSWTARIEGDTGELARPVDYVLSTASPKVGERFRSLLFDDGGDDDYGVIRSDILRRTSQFGSHYRSDRTIVADLALYGRFHQVPEWLYFRRDIPTRLSRQTGVKAWCAAQDHRRAGWKHPTARLLAEYVLAYVKAIRRAPLTSAERRECFRYLLAWVVNRLVPGGKKLVRDPGREAVIGPPSVPIGGVVAGADSRSA